MRIAVFAGSFDPPSLGHLDIIQRAAGLVDRLIVGISLKESKRALFTTSEKQALLRSAASRLPNVEIRTFEGLAVDFAKHCKASHLVRGLRAFTDPNHEFQMALANRRLAGLETLFVLGDERLSHVSSTLIREIAAVGGALQEFVPPQVETALREKFR